MTHTDILQSIAEAQRAFHDRDILRYAQDVAALLTCESAASISRSPAPRPGCYTNSRNSPAHHDDCPDALEMALRLTTELLAGHHQSDGLDNRLPVG